MNTGYSRQNERHPVNLSVRYSTARDFVVDYAENLSTGGLFVRGAHVLARGQEVDIEIALPGFGSFGVEARVAHVLSPEDARDHDRNPGAGFSITRSPPGFIEALRTYLLRLGQRRDHVVMVSDESIAQLLEASGYQVRPLPLADLLSEAVARSKAPVVGVVVPSALETEYADQAAQMGAPELILAFEDPRDIDQLLEQLDAELFRSRSD